ncbi:hypothetical protein IPF86_02970 [Candidatus Nomurabacteria bacterium]|nr:MAG: hypothetical protein IPF86_02970 [Candidatus Nomurabacteria bacterium]
MKETKTMTDEELKNLATEVQNEQKKRQIKKMSDDELYKIAKAKNNEYSDEEALFAVNILLKKDKPNLEIITTLKQMSHCRAVRDKCKEFLFC